MISRIRSRFPGVSWRNPIIKVGISLLNPLDFIVRCVNGLGSLPNYRLRVKSNGISKQFGGTRFFGEGQDLHQIIEKATSLTYNDQVLEIGCGCGRVAIHMGRFLEYGHYSGMEIDPFSLQGCKKNRILIDKGANLDLMDIYNGVYNPHGNHSDVDYSFPYCEKIFDVIYLISVFTHMLPSGVSNYLREIARMLKPNGRCFFTSFLIDEGHIGRNIQFPFKLDQCYIANENLPEKAVGYSLSFFESVSRKYGLKRTHEPYFGTWRGDLINIQPTIEFPQDALVYSKM